ncbi:hypothetical protein HD597_002056 [Nonomuraea thailandensis]|uniref:Uncharacterized protein n=1 Tax=Nonomuraea thailandensis TaxID=1188745 RepID=A0A9X2GGN0_9ACTN|nr:hypothetical protein [Nonomuraea thailandensis]MCP2355036.1 hypothetical protein [Nonomuraea thailandensis]
MKIFGREPALVLGLLSAGLQLVTALFLPLTIEQVAAINSLAAAGLGVWTAFATRDLDGGRSIKAAALGVAQAGITLGLVFGVSLTDQQTASIMAFVALLGAVLVRQQSTPAATVTPAATGATITGAGTGAAPSAAAAGEALPPSP